MVGDRSWSACSPAESSPAVACRCRSRTHQDGSREPTPAALGVEHPGTSNLDPTPLFPFGHQIVGVPENLSIVGFDDTPLARLLSPPLTTVRQPLREMGQVALRTALRLAAGERLDSHHVELATELVVRSSTAPVVR